MIILPKFPCLRTFTDPTFNPYWIKFRILRTLLNVDTIPGPYSLVPGTSSVQPPLGTVCFDANSSHPWHSGGNCLQTTRFPISVAGSVWAFTDPETDWKWNMKALDTQGRTLSGVQFREFFCGSTLRTRLQVYRGLAPFHSLSCFTHFLTSFPWDFALKKLTILASLT